MIIPLFKPYMPEIPDIMSILSSEQLAYGVYTKKFEKLLREYFATPFVMVTDTFSSAISVVISTLGLKCGDEVILSPMACLASTQPYLANGLKVRWSDVDPKRGTLDPDFLRKKVSANTKAIVHNHFCGYPGYIDEINQIANEYGIPVINDGIECFGSEYKGNRVGNCGSDITVFSFSAVRIPNTIDGGAIVFKNCELFEKALRIRDLGIDRNQFRDDIGEINPYCDIMEIGYSATMSNVNGYIGIQQMKNIDRLLNIQRKNAKRYQDYFERKKGYSILSSADTMPNYWVYGVLAEKKMDAIENLRQQGVYASGVHINNNRYTVFGDKGVLSGVNEFYSHFVAVPCGWWMETDKWISEQQAYKKQ